MEKPKITIQPIEQAPNLQLLKEKFGANEKYSIIAYGDKIYCPAEGMSQDLLVHEMTHCERQGMREDSAERWWKMYIRDENFRLKEEVIAYQAQFNFCKKVYKDRNRLDKIRRALAQELSSELYGNIISNSEAMELIK